MKKINLLKSLFFLLIMLFSSCNENESTQPEPEPIQLVSILIPTDFALSDVKFYVVASNQAGAIITYKEIVRNNVITLETNDYKESTFNLSLVNIAGGQISGETFGHIPVGINLVLPPKEQQQELRIQVNSFNNNFDSYTIGAHGSWNTFWNNLDTRLIRPRKFPTPLFISRVNTNDEPEGFMFNQQQVYQPSTGENSTVINLTGTYNPYSIEYITPPDNLILEEVDLYGYNEDDGFKKSFFVGTSEFSGLQNEKVFYPGSTFDHYASFSYAYTNEIDYKAFNLNKKYDFILPAFTYTQSYQNNTFTFQCDLSNGYFTTWLDGNDQQPSWVIHSSLENQAVIFPDLPTDITNQIDEYNKMNWIFSEVIEITTFEDPIEWNKLILEEFESGVSLVDLNTNYKRFRIYTDIELRDSSKRKKKNTNRY